MIEKKDFITINEYLDTINFALSKYKSRVIGEVTEVQMYPGQKYLFFKIKDKEASAVLTCMMWKSDYSFCGLDLEVGLEIIVSGSANVYKPYGRFSFMPKTIELVGEGALKIAYDKLKEKLQKEGLFEDARKKPIPIYPNKIGLITSANGAVIHDFETNLGRYGFQIKFIDTRVEGQLAVQEIMSAIDSFSKADIDVLVIIRGGGSLESMQAFNNEALVRRIASFNKPVICGIGHEKDVPLASLVADVMVSTPTAVTHALNKSWQEAVHQLKANKEIIFSSFKDYISGSNRNVNHSFDIMKKHLQSILDDFKIAEESLKRSFVSIKSRISEIKRSIVEYPRIINDQMKSALNKIKGNILSAEKLIMKSNPEAQLKLGYSIVQSAGVLIRKINQIKKGQIVNVRVENGSFESEVKIISNK